MALTRKKSDDFMEWYLEVCDVAELCDKRYEIKGMNVWRPYAWKVMHNIDEFTRKEMARTEHDEVLFPLMIPEKSFQKESEQIKGFGGEVFWVDFAGENKLDERYVIRPTSETAMYPMFKIWVRSHADLPLRTFQIVNVFRYETKQTRPFMRVREIHFFEDHSCFATYEDSEAHMQVDLEVVRNCLTRLALPYLTCRRPDWDKFPGAHYSVGCDVVMPSGRTLQCATVHQYKDNFAKAYEISFEAPDGSRKFAHQTTFGMSERLVGAIVGVHGDDRGLILPPEVAPIQVVVVPILFKGKEQPVLDAAREVAHRLREKGLRVHLDDRDRNAGEKYYHWELRGVPLRLEIGPRDLEKGSVMTVRRDGGKAIVPMPQVEAEVEKLLQHVQADLLERQTLFQNTQIHKAHKIEEARKLGGIVVLPICDKAECGHGVEEALDYKTLGVPMDEASDASQESCAHCGKAAKEWIRFARTY
ncbi:MAG TPA: proline--tRNA ligase [Candidatus Thermoplasmatota archaeon]|nr:proline--tRNA ligase [Candidatus Thermoplasmatota archaeon]